MNFASVTNRAISIATIAIAASLLYARALANSAVPRDRPSVSVVAEPFEPPNWAFYNPANQFSHPPEVLVPQPMWPIEMRHGFVGTVIVLVRSDMDGYPRDLRVLSSDHKFFTREAILALERARWKPSKRQVWFYYKFVFDPNQMLKDG